ncbi:hypothetical protein AB0C15_10630 [Micromonospora sp. NPDC048835]|uniref:hypothetical protein n=1 Tax=Micromonospora sp. NPDC048835 TaxID=3155147 RepID=UPI0034066DE5
MTELLRLDRQLLDRFLLAVEERFPRKTFGYFLADEPDGKPTDFIFFEDNVRDDWRAEFIKYGQYFIDHDDAGFLATPEESWRVARHIRDAGLHEVGVFHSHQRHPGLLATVDVDLHPSPQLWHLLIVLRNLKYPQVRAFSVADGGRVAEMEIDIIDERGRTLDHV